MLACQNITKRSEESIGQRIDYQIIKQTVDTKEKIHKFVTAQKQKVI